MAIGAAYFQFTNPRVRAQAQPLPELYEIAIAGVTQK